MRKSNKKMIVTISIIAVIIILITAGVLLYLYTDLFKSDQQLFLKYIAQNGEMITKYLENPNQDNIRDLKQNKYSVQGNIAFDLVSKDTALANQTIPARNFSVEYTSQVDPQLKQNSTQTTLKFLDQDLFELKYAHDNDLYGITSSEVINKYLTFDNNNLKELATKYGITDASNIPNKIEAVDFSQVFAVTNAEIQYILENYGSIFMTQIQKDKYYHNKGIIISVGNNQIKGNCYGVNLTGEDVKNLLTQILNKLEQDEQILSLIIQRVKMVDSGIQITKEQLKEAIMQLNTDLQENTEIQGIKIEVCEAEGKIVKQSVELEDGSISTVEYETNEDSIRIFVTYNYPNEEVDFSVRNIELAKQSKIGQSNNVAIFTIDAGDKTYKISVQNKMEQNASRINNNLIVNISDLTTTYFTIKANTITKQSNDVIVEQLTDENSAIINNFTPEYATDLMQRISKRLETLFTQKLLIVTATQEEAEVQNVSNTGIRTY